MTNKHVLFRLSMILIAAALLVGGGLAFSATRPALADYNGAIAFPADSCQGFRACESASGPIGNNSCNGDYACSLTKGPIGDNSCNGSDACIAGSGPIGSNSCNGDRACIGPKGSIGSNACNGGWACFAIEVSIGSCSCNGNSVCPKPSSPIGDGQNNLGSVPAICNYDGDDDDSGWTPPFAPAVQPVDDDTLMALPAADGRLACGLFDLNSTVPPTGWGFKSAFLTGWPDCPQDGNQLDMLCLNGEATWVEPAFEDIKVRDDGLEITWFSKQDGVCGFFPK